MNPYQTFVTSFSQSLKEARGYPLGQFAAPAPVPKREPGAPKVLVFSPHPDDECIVGGVAVRLMREAGMQVVNVAVTQGSNKERQAPRYRELQHACEYLGFGLVPTAANGLEKINPKTRQQDPAHWSKCVETVAAILKQQQARILVFPHAQDWNSTHIGTHYLVMDALKELPADYTCYLVETEFWGQMTDPNLMVEIGANDLADLIAALTFHVGEVARNPYHLLLPAWMMDNVRRGSELVGGQGGAAPEFPFATLYRLRRWQNGQATSFYTGGKQVPATVKIGGLFA